MAVENAAGSDSPVLESRRLWPAVIPYYLLAVAVWSAAEALFLWAPAGGEVWGLLWTWGYSQALVIGKLLEVLQPLAPVRGLSFVAHGAWLGAYVVLAAVISTVVEGSGNRKTLGCWRRACASWVLIVILYSFAAALLISMGYLRD